ncbi:carboxypeptidase-like regulatory domain-containing protein [Dysgonomonas macrotermitis]|uniref:CarboxypepD_reg-like domain-containing protein n=1 Tax=Dysgonomonas macrotermitis TaxID=1346286 RepID=A0A1M5GYG5_9BACT|nr:carboxypeptidase-like regulatory domain-containing protein [Dysgonomonas macrotermitis]SHG08615.1 CarboxypepD_reg-like domain-containing protein [Dysgonomonas macrotermitis]
MKAKLGIVLLLLCVVSFFFYNKRGGGVKQEEKTEKLLNGVVLNASDDKPISNVQIAIAGNNPQTMTNSEGEYLILVRPTQELIFKHPAYRSVTIAASEAKTVKMELIDSSFIKKAEENLSVTGQ